MKKDMQYVQCKLKKYKGNEDIGFSAQYCHYWIPKFGSNKVEVKVGRLVELNKDDWWEVISMSESRDGFRVKERERDYKKLHTAQPLQRGNK